MIASDLKRGRFDLRKSTSRARGVDLADKMQGELTHPAAKDVRDTFPTIWDAYFKFCFVRNPYAHAVSFWKWRTRSLNRQMGFTEFLKRLNGDLPNDQDDMGRQTPWGLTGWKIYTIDDEIAVDYVGKWRTCRSSIGPACHLTGTDFRTVWGLPTRMRHIATITAATKRHLLNAFTPKNCTPSIMISE